MRSHCDERIRKNERNCFSGIQGVASVVVRSTAQVQGGAGSKHQEEFKDTFFNLTNGLYLASILFLNEIHTVNV